MSKEERLAEWVKLKHAGQVKKYSRQPYFVHLSHVAEMAQAATYLGYEIGLCHDLLEDTATSGQELTAALRSFGYDGASANHITAAVIELTDVFTAAAYPLLSRNARKELEAIRLSRISPGAQTVKYADLSDNMEIIIRYAPQHAAIYLQKKQLLLANMKDGRETLREKALMVIQRYVNP